MRCVGVDPKKSAKLEPYLAADDKVIHSLEQVSIEWLRDLMPEKTSSPGAIEAAIFDFDGVISSTEDLHFEAWTRMFREELTAHSELVERKYTYNDHGKYVLGRPRYDGALLLLVAAGIPELQCVKDFDHYVDSMRNPVDFGRLTGEQQQAMERIKVLADKKDGYYKEILQTRPDEIKLLPGAAERLKDLKQRGIKIALISSSKNAPQALSLLFVKHEKEFGTNKTRDFFGAIVAGTSLGQHSTLLGKAIQGKPEPDMFLEAALRLGADPERCVGFEDAPAGIDAIKAAGMLAVFVDPTNKGLESENADARYKDLSKVDVDVLEEAVVAKQPGVKSASAGKLIERTDLLESIKAVTVKLDANKLIAINPLDRSGNVRLNIASVYDKDSVELADLQEELGNCTIRLTTQLTEEDVNGKEVVLISDTEIALPYEEFADQSGKINGKIKRIGIPEDAVTEQEHPLAFVICVATQLFGNNTLADLDNALNRRLQGSAIFATLFGQQVSREAIERFLATGFFELPVPTVDYKAIRDIQKSALLAAIAA